MTILKCSPPCNKRNYEMQPATNILTGCARQCAKIQLNVNSFSYSCFTENYVWTVEDIIAALGGILALWLGIDIKRSIEFLGSAIYLLHSFVVTCRLKDDNSDDNNSEIQNADHRECRRHTMVVVIPD